MRFPIGGFLRSEISAIRTRSHCVARSPVCEICESSDRVQGHHEDYLRPWDLIALCLPCHRRRHSRLRAQGRAPEHRYLDARINGAACPISFDPVACAVDYRDALSAAGVSLAPSRLEVPCGWGAPPRAFRRAAQ